MSYEGLRYLIETSFHEDWDLDGPTDSDVIREFAVRDPGRVPEVLSDIQSYLAGNPKAEVTAEWLNAAGLSYDPAPLGLDANEWLARLSGFLERYNT